MKNDSQIGFLLTLFFIGFSFHSAMLAFGTLFLLKNLEAFYFLLIANHFVLGLLAVLGVYMTYHIFWPSKSPRLGICLIGLIGGLGILQTITTRPQPFIIPGYGVDFDSDLILSFLLWLLFIVSIGTPLYVFSRLFLSTTSVELKRLSLLIAFLAVLGIINVSIRLITFIDFPTFLRLRMFDIGVGLVGIFFFVTLFLVPQVRKFIRKTKESRN